jgi:Na+-transporting NADH:ubiquinone oxidoreductase subunit C
VKKQVISVLYMFMISLFFAALVGAVKGINEARIESNRIEKLRRVILGVLNIPVERGVSAADLSLLFSARVMDIKVEDRTLYVGYETDGRTVSGYALPVGGPGFWGPISGIVGISPDGGKITGLAFYRHNETPGLGGRITEDWFTGQFKGLPIFPVEGDRNIFYLRPEGTGSAPNELDAITGATNTSAAVQAFLNRELDTFLREIWAGIGEGE